MPQITPPGPASARRGFFLTPLPNAANDSDAKTSLILGIASVMCCGLLGIPAAVVGHIARRRIRKSEGRLKGEEIAFAGMVIGYASFGIVAAIVLASLVAYRMAARHFPEHQTGAVNAIRQIMEAENAYDQRYRGHYGPAYATLAMLGPGRDPGCSAGGNDKYACLLSGPLAQPECREAHWCSLNGYKFQLAVYPYPATRDSTYVITATPEDSLQGETNLCAMNDGVVRAETAPPKKLWGFNADECLKMTPLADDK
jgi:uncharacterized protein DUF4190